MYICARCHRHMLTAAIEVEQGTTRLPYGRRCAEILGILTARPRIRLFTHRRRRDERQGALSFEVAA